MRKNRVKLMAAGMLVLTLMTGCGPNDNDISEGSSSIISMSNTMDTEEAGYISGEQESWTDTETEQMEESSRPQPQSQSQLQPQPQDTGTAEDIGEELAAYRAEREKGTSSLGNYMMVTLPNEENYHNGIGDSSYTSRFDTRELNEAFEAADAYIKNTLNLESEVWTCVDPRMTAIYEDDDKGVANGYDADNIFLCEYNDNGNWQYLILVREGKGSEWEVLHHGSSYKLDMR